MRETRHLVEVLRARVGDRFTVFDGEREALAEVEAEEEAHAGRDRGRGTFVARRLLVFLTITDKIRKRTDIPM